MIVRPWLSARTVSQQRKALDWGQSLAYAHNVRGKQHASLVSPCLCTALRQASRAVSRLYDDELRRAGLRVTQYSLLSRLSRVGDVRQRDLGRMTALDETTLTRNLQRLIDASWVDTTTGDDEREKLVRLTKHGIAKLRQARPAWERAQRRMRSRLRNGKFAALLAALPDLAQVANEA